MEEIMWLTWQSMLTLWITLPISYMPREYLRLKKNLTWVEAFKTDNESRGDQTRCPAQSTNLVLSRPGWAGPPEKSPILDSLTNLPWCQKLWRRARHAMTDCDSSTTTGGREMGKVYPLKGEGVCNQRCFVRRGAMGDPLTVFPKLLFGHGAGSIDRNMSTIEYDGDSDHCHSPYP